MEHNCSFNKQLTKEKLSVFTDFVEKQKKDNEIYLGLFLEFAKKQGCVQSNTSELFDRRYEKIEKRLFYDRLF